MALLEATRPGGRLLRAHEQARRRVLQPLGGRVLAADRGGPERAGGVRGRRARRAAHPEGEPLQPGGADQVHHGLLPGGVEEGRLEG